MSKEEAPLYTIASKSTHKFGNANALRSSVLSQEEARSFAIGRSRDQSRSTTSASTLNITHNNLKDRSMVEECMDVYDHTGIIKNVVDMMGDFASEGVDLVHTNKSVQNFWTKWLETVKIKDRTERMSNIILKAGTCVIRRREAILTSKQERDMKSAAGATKPKKIPVGYTILNPRTFNITGVEANGTPIIEVNTKNSGTVDMGTKTNTIELNTDGKSYICTYKKDDWEKWAKPFHFAILDDLALENKMQRMDESAVDGVINAVRIWKLGGELKDGSPVIPTPVATGKLASILQEDMGGGVLDIIWDRHIDLQVEYPPIKDILDQKKYEHVRQRILEGLGIAQVLIDGTGQGSYSNQYLSVRSLIEKIEYLRNILTDWLRREINYVHEEMGFKKLPTISFKHIDLGDEITRISMLLQLFDRNIISKESMLTSIEHNWDVEKPRLNIEKDEEETEKSKQNKIGPYLVEEELAEDGKKENKDGGDGRPANQPGDKTQKTKRKTKPKGADAELIDGLFEAEEILANVEEVLNPIYLEKAGVTNVKKLTKEKKDDLANMKFSVFASTKRNCIMNKEYVERFCNDTTSSLESSTKKRYDDILAKFREKHGDPSLSQVKRLQVMAWSTVRCEGE